MARKRRGSRGFAPHTAGGFEAARRTAPELPGGVGRCSPDASPCSTLGHRVTVGTERPRWAAPARRAEPDLSAAQLPSTKRWPAFWVKIHQSPPIEGGGEAG